MKTYKVAVTGGRDHQITDEEKYRFLNLLHQRWVSASEGYAGAVQVLVLHGRCRGVDQRAAEIAESAGFPTVPFEAPWEWRYKLDKKPFHLAGPLRNWMMLKAADLLVAFPGGKGTANAVRQAGELSVEVVRIGPL